MTEEADLAFRSATEVAELVRRGELDEVELIDALLRRISAVNPQLVAYCTVDEEGARRAAALAHQQRVSGAPLGPLHGVPVSVKDLIDTAGLRTTYGWSEMREHVPRRDALTVSRLREAGAIIVGKTNTPTFEGGGNTVNRVFGATRNPWDISLTAGGSSGGSGAAVAAGLAPISLGTDLGGSLRIPASFCGVMALRPTPGAIPVLPTDVAWDTFGTEGPMARTVADLALAADVLMGPCDDAPLSSERPGSISEAATSSLIGGLRVAVSPDLELMPIEPEVRSAVMDAAALLGDAARSVNERHPDWKSGMHAVEVFRCLRMAIKHGEKLPRFTKTLEPQFVENIERGLRLSGAEIAAADRLRTSLILQTASFFATYDVLIAAVSPVLPFPITQNYPTHIGNAPVADYVQWLALTYVPAVVGLPALAMPAGFSASGVPIGLQIIGRWRSEQLLFRVAAFLETRLRDTVAARPAAFA